VTKYEKLAYILVISENSGVQGITSEELTGVGWVWFLGTSQKLYELTKMSVMELSFAPSLPRDKEHPMHKQHSRLSEDTMKSLSPVAQTLKPLRIPSDRCSL
jgi:hypothetical protein